MNAREFAPTALRVGIALVVLWFGMSQVIAPADWTGFLPSWMPTLGLSPETHVLLNGGAEIILGSLILLGLFTRIAASLSAAHMYAVTLAVGYSAVGIRDFGIFIGLLAIALYGADSLTIDAWRAKPQQTKR